MKIFLVFLSLCVCALSAETLHVGSKLSQLNSFKYETPNGREVKIPKTVSLVIVAFEKDTGILVNEYLNTKDSFYLQKNNSIFIADIHDTPKFLTNMFALPKLRKFKHPIYLHYEDKFHTVVPSKKKKVTLVHIKDSKIDNISYISTKEALKAAIENFSIN
ncbi:MAG: hypothetical protein OQK48_02890 [Sulfurimonas sp.]|uniref:hypothetical protein n=1 Tax=Sulfurimonas sp. TaxID=2022749 RepID=UPI002615D7D3|nr:hypothetical protein [Sulfurimonas sp.]MCW8895414.1 hypothetical protein [Sulfurimonas sp.]MCW8953867.1 hypothetical protein [Sulfurimonas sp.]MCW9067969.1 hypothetical protein [Sulfurimonas sp.]